MIWYDMIWYDMIWYDMIWYDIIWYDMIWYDMIWYDMTWYDMTSCCKLCTFTSIYSPRFTDYLFLNSFSHWFIPSSFQLDIDASMLLDGFGDSEHIAEAGGNSELLYRLVHAGSDFHSLDPTDIKGLPKLNEFKNR